MQISRPEQRLKRFVVHLSEGGRPLCGGGRGARSVLGWQVEISEVTCKRCRVIAEARQMKNKPRFEIGQKVFLKGTSSYGTTTFKQCTVIDLNEHVGAVKVLYGIKSSHAKWVAATELTTTKENLCKSET